MPLSKITPDSLGGVPAFSAYSTSNQSISSGAITKVNFGTEEFDTNNNFASSRFTPTVAGYYQINAQVYANAASLLTFFQPLLYKGTTLIKIGTTYNGPAITEFSSTLSTVVYMNGTTDYLEIS